MVNGLASAYTRACITHCVTVQHQKIKQNKKIKHSKMKEAWHPCYKGNTNTFTSLLHGQMSCNGLSITVVRTTTLGQAWVKSSILLRLMGVRAHSTRAAHYMTTLPLLQYLPLQNSYKEVALSKWLIPWKIPNTLKCLDKKCWFGN